ncbi:MAG: sulfotransferase domain-containing protein [Paracoccaceae bacterium]
MAGAPTQTRRVYQNHLIDSTRWQGFRPRADDIIVATPYKCGTTWVQNIVLHLIFQDLAPRVIDEHSPWIDFRLAPIADILARCEAQTHRRCLKSHLPFDGIPCFEAAKYIVVGRDPRDVFMSLWNHYSAYTPKMYRDANETPGRAGPPLPPCPDDIRVFWDMWINRGWFDWEREGYPHWSNFRHVQTWWEQRHRANILFVHFNDLLTDLQGGIARIARYLGIDCAPDMLKAIAGATTFESMKRHAEKLDPTARAHFRGGARTFFNKGTNGRWRGVLTEGDLAMYQATAARELAPNCRAWLEGGRQEPA